MPCHPAKGSFLPKAITSTRLAESLLLSTIHGGSAQDPLFQLFYKRLCGSL